MRFFIFFLGFLFYLLPISTLAQRPPIDAVLVIDVSNSMRNSDPNRIAQEAMVLFIEKLTVTNDRIGIVAYAGEVTDYLPLTTVNNEDDKMDIISFVHALGYAGWTDHTKGLNKALSLLIDDNHATSGSGSVPMMILLTDGNNELPPYSLRTLADVYEDLQGILMQANELGSVIHTIGLNHNGTLNQQYIENIASATHGRAFETTHVQDLPFIMGEIFALQLALIENNLQILDIPVEPEAKLEPKIIVTSHHNDNQIIEEMMTNYADIEEINCLFTIYTAISALIIVSMIIYFLRRKSKRVFTGAVIISSANNLATHHDLIPFGKRVALHKLLNINDVHLSRIILLPSPTAPSHSPQLRIINKDPRTKIINNFIDIDAKKGLNINPTTEITIQLPNDAPAIQLKYVLG